MTDAEQVPAAPPPWGPEVIGGFVLFVLATDFVCLIAVLGVLIGFALLVVASALAYVAVKIAGWRPAVPAVFTGVGLFVLIPVFNDIQGGPTRWHLALASGFLLAVGVVLLGRQLHAARWD
ncbi:MAG: hypothetical protein Q8P38_10480 [Candidatus Nanopelagicales bacterium]|nr:hypothetical protein [Candidatus Nanopelagicales bacterium]